jgi:pSer/pThr/pTyr-binding forkhead associated (FHA) protein
MRNSNLAVRTAGAGPRRMRAAARNGLHRVRASQRTESRAPFLVITQGPGAGRQVVLSSWCVIGRAADADVVLQDRRVSRRHASIMLRGTEHVLKDLASRNGTILNDQEVLAGTLLDGDMIRVGRVTLVFRVPRSRGSVRSVDPLPSKP